MRWSFKGKSSKEATRALHDIIGHDSKQVMSIKKDFKIPLKVYRKSFKCVRVVRQQIFALFLNISSLHPLKIMHLFQIKWKTDEKIGCTFIHLDSLRYTVCPKLKGWINSFESPQITTTTTIFDMSGIKCLSPACMVPFTESGFLIVSHVLRILDTQAASITCPHVR